MRIAVTGDDSVTAIVRAAFPDADVSTDVARAMVVVAVVSSASSLAEATRRDVDLVWSGPPSAEEVERLARIVRARDVRRDSALDDVLRLQAQKLAELRASIDREDVPAAREPPRRDPNAPMQVDDENAFRALARHEERRARVHGRALAIVILDLPRAEIGVALRPFDVLLVGDRGISAALLPEADSSLAVPGARIAWFPSSDAAADVLSRR
jgi:hypothetical protein